ncbi:MAG TPA: hypothetical protein ENI33_09220, partial [Thermoplasmatales archaeon]|nr:hypothetical protein [Thermoplasmatales archaeon]
MADKCKGKIIGVLVLGIFLIISVFPYTAVGENGNSVEERNTSLSYEITFIEPVLKEKSLFNNSFSEISMYDCINIGEIGKPALPVHGTKILLPYGKEIKNIEIYGDSIEVNTRGIDLKEKPIFPYQPPVPIG